MSGYPGMRRIGKPTAVGMRQAKPSAALSASSARIDAIAMRLRFLGLPEPVREHRFHESRRWRFDLAWPEHRLAVEYDGGTYSAAPGGHSSKAGMARDREKDAHAMIAGWSVIRLDAKTYSKTGIGWIEEWFNVRGIG